MQCQRRNRSLAVAYLDLDGFKTVNDTYGHDVGDELLVELSKRMKEALREGDTLGRIGVTGQTRPLLLLCSYFNRFFFFRFRLLLVFFTGVISFTSDNK